MRAWTFGIFGFVAACGSAQQGLSPPESTPSETVASGDPIAAPTSSPAPASGLGAVEQELVDAHNRVRAKHCAAPLAWSPKLAAVAQGWANTLRDKNCAFDHSGGSYGENLAAGSSGAFPPNAVVTMWYDEVGQYRFPDGGFSMQTGHFTQVVWRGTTQLGCGMAQCKGMDVWVCNYDPPGNWEGQYKTNVLPLGCVP